MRALPKHINPPCFIQQGKSGKNKKNVKITLRRVHGEIAPIWLTAGWREHATLRYVIDAPAAVKIPSGCPLKRAERKKAGALAGA